MKMGPYDQVLGISVALLIALAMWGAGGASGLAYFIWLCVMARLALTLWAQQSHASRVLAAILLPAVLLTCLLPRRLKRAIRALEEHPQP